MPSKHSIKVNNTQELTAIIEGIVQRLGLKNATMAGAGLSVYIEAILRIAQHEGIDLARRNLDRAIELMTAMRQAPHFEAMEATAIEISLRQNAEVLKRDAE